MFDGVKIFSATLQKDREELGETITHWLNDRAGTLEIVDKLVTQSSDSKYHCVTVTLFYRHRRAAT